MEWKDVSIKDYEELVQYNGQDCFSDKAIEILMGVEDPQSLQVSQYLKCLSELQFVGEPIKPEKLVTSWKVDDREYEIDINTPSFTIGQFTDFENYKKQQPYSLIDILSVVVIPKGHKYNDGYDMDAVKSDIGTMRITLGYAIFNFFAQWCFRYVNTLNSYLKHQKNQDKRLVKILEKMETTLNLLR